jgi:HSP20 family protein
MSLVKFNSDRKNNALMPGFNDIFENFFNDSMFNDRMVSRLPAANISESAEEYHIELAAPGLKKDQFKLRVDDQVLSIAVEQQQENSENNRRYNKREFSYSSFVRSFTLPESADDARITAEYSDGVLKINVPKKEEAKSVSRQIEIK